MKNNRGGKTKLLWENPEYREHMKQAHTGIKMPVFSQEHREKLRAANLGKPFTKKRRENISKAQLGKPRFNQRGEKSSFWKGGRTELKLSIKNTIEYRQWRSDVYTRDDFRCQICNNRGGQIEVHHINPFASILEINKIKSLFDALNCSELWNINNGQTLCRKCHYKTDSYGRPKKQI